MIPIAIKDETSKLQSVVLGVAESFGGVPTLSEAYDPKSKEHIQAGAYPKEADLIEEMGELEQALLKHGVKVYRPRLLPDTNQIFARDIGFVIDDKFVQPNTIANKAYEQTGIDHIVAQIDPSKSIKMPKEAHTEGGDIMPWKGKIYIGYSEEEDYHTYQVSRTNRAGVEFIKQHFPHSEVFAFELNKSDTDPRANALHLDCCFQPIGHDQCIIYKGGFKNPSDYDLLIGHFGASHCITIDREEMYQMTANVFSISPQVIVSERGFTRLNHELERRGFIVEKVKYSEAAKMEGLLRCSTLPLARVES